MVNDLSALNEEQLTFYNDYADEIQTVHVLMMKMRNCHIENTLGNLLRELDKFTESEHEPLETIPFLSDCVGIIRLLYGVG
jgi:hypothetical protein